MLESTRSMAETAGNYGTGAVITRDGNAAILNEKHGAIPKPQIADIVGKVMYNKDGSGAILRAKLSGSTQVLDNEASNGYSPGNELFETQEMELDFTPSSIGGSGRRLSNDVNTSNALLDSLDRLVTKLKVVLNETVNMNMNGVDPRVKQFAGQHLIPLKIDLHENDKVLEVFCSDIAATFEQKPYIVSFDIDCGSETYLTSSQALTNRRADTSSTVPSEHACGSLKLTRRWTVKDKCENPDGEEKRESSVDQIIYVKPEAPIWTHVPWSMSVSVS